MKLTLVFLILLCQISTLQAEIIEERALSFGTIALIHNNSVGRITMDKFGNYSVDNNFRVITPGNFAIFRVTGLPVNSSIPVDIRVLNPSMNPGRVYEETFTLSVTSFDEQLRSDNTGEAILRMGGNLTTSGNRNRNFPQATFQSQIRITINF